MTPGAARGCFQITGILGLRAIVSYWETGSGSLENDDTREPWLEVVSLFAVSFSLEPLPNF